MVRSIMEKGNNLRLKGGPIRFGKAEKGKKHQSKVRNAEERTGAHIVAKSSENREEEKKK